MVQERGPPPRGITALFAQIRRESGLVEERCGTLIDVRPWDEGLEPGSWRHRAVRVHRTLPPRATVEAGTNDGELTRIGLRGVQKLELDAAKRCGTS
jgi:hypothetical protein